MKGTIIYHKVRMKCKITQLATYLLEYKEEYSMCNDNFSHLEIQLGTFILGRFEFYVVFWGHLDLRY